MWSRHSDGRFRKRSSHFGSMVSQFAEGLETHEATWATSGIWTRTDVEVKEVNGGSKVSSFILAVDRSADEANFALLHH